MTAIDCWRVPVAPADSQQPSMAAAISATDLRSRNVANMPAVARSRALSLTAEERTAKLAPGDSLSMRLATSSDKSVGTGGCSSLTYVGITHVRSTGRPSRWRTANPAALPPTTRSSATVGSSMSTGSVHNGYLVNREQGRHLGTLAGDEEHLLEPHAPLQHLAVLRLECEAHPFLNVDRIVERVDPTDHRHVVLRQPESVPPQVGG